MLPKQIFKMLSLIIIVVMMGCVTTEKSITTTTDSTKISSRGSSGKLYYEVPENIDLTDIINGTSYNAKSEQIYGRLLMPDNYEGKIAAVVIMHASGGVFDWRELSIAKLLNKSGIAAFIPYSFIARGFHNTKSTSATGTTFGMRVADAFSALKLLSSHPDIDQNRIGIMGYSSGGFASLLSYDEKVRKKMVEGNLKFAAHVNVYAASILIFKENQPTNSPMLFLMGEKDNTCPLNKMIAYTEKLKDAGGEIRTIVYPGAHHAFDAQGSVRTLKAENDGNCQFQILNNGNLVDSVTGEQFPERDLYSNDKKHIAPCKTNTVSFGRNNFAAKQYKKDVIDFFVNTLNP